jgi:hypothetical protein
MQTLIIHTAVWITVELFFNTVKTQYCCAIQAIRREKFNGF